MGPMGMRRMAQRPSGGSGSGKPRTPLGRSGLRSTRCLWLAHARTARVEDGLDFLRS
jgi:hypothetical protein